jgi:Cu(I)/Ag(I) efflux system membrane fusion protein
MTASEQASASGAAGAEPVLTRWQKAKLVIKVVELRLRFIALMAITGLTFYYWDTIWNRYEKWSRPAAIPSAAASDTEYYCPMHPSVVRESPGNCPICGMPLSKRKKGQQQEALPEGVASRVQLAPFRVAQAGIRTVPVGYEPLAETVTTVGNVAFDERRLARISSKIKGMSRVEALHVNFTGTPVKAGQVLAELYSPELYQATQELLLAHRRLQSSSGPQSTAGRSLLGDAGELVRAARERLRLWGVTPAQVDQILARGKAEDRFPILAPIGGVVVKKNIVEGQYVAEGEAMFEVADLTHVWVQAKVYEDQFDRIRVSQVVEATVAALPGRVFDGRVAFIDPAFDQATRTVNVRYDLDNAEGRLSPGMYATVTLKTPVRDTPAFKTRYAGAGPAARPIRLLNLSVAEQQVCPVTKAKLGSMGEPIAVEVEGGKVWVCCAGCPPQLKRDVKSYLASLDLRPTLTPEEQQVCPVTKAKLGSMGNPIAVEVEGRKVWVCCEGCPPKLKADLSRYLARLERAPKDGVLSVPESAVIDTGDRMLVYVETEPGVFEGKAVTLGARIGDRFPVLEGLDPGDRVAAAGAFLIDAETRLNPVASPAAPAATPAPVAQAPPRAHVH